MAREPVFLYHGGNYKRHIDNERLRVPLNPVEIDEVFYDPHVPLDTDNSIATELDMSRYADVFCHLEVGDEFYVAIVPDAALYRGLWAMAFNAVKDFRVEFDLVRARDVWNAFVSGRTLAQLGRVGGTSILPYDFSDGLGMNSWNADVQAKLPYSTGNYDDYRNNAALKFSAIDPGHFAFLGEAMYIRMTIKNIGSFSATDPQGCCNKCHERKFPVFQVGCIYDRVCADKQRWVKYCNCDFGLCRYGCDGMPPRPQLTYDAVPVRFLNTAGQKIRPTEVIRLYPGETKTVTPPVISGYSTPPSQQVTSAMDEVTFRYTPTAIP